MARHLLSSMERGHKPRACMYRIYDYSPLNRYIWFHTGSFSELKCNTTLKAAAHSFLVAQFDNFNLNVYHEC